MSGNLCNTIVNAILNQALAHLHLEFRMVQPFLCFLKQNLPKLDENMNYYYCY